MVKQQKKENRVGKYFRSVIAELKKVALPNRRETTVYTIVVIVTVIVVALLLGVLTCCWVWSLRVGSINPVSVFSVFGLTPAAGHR